MIRDANVYDIPRINELGNLLHKNFERVFKINEMLEDEISKVIVYEKEDRVVGFILATDLGETCDILSIVVDPDYRRLMIGTNLIGYLISDLSDVKLITLEVASKNKAAISLYNKFGFEMIHTREHYYDDGDDAYLMARKSE